MRTEEEKDSQKPLIQFLTDEKQFETLGSIRQSKDAESNLNHLEFNTISEAQPVSPRLSDLHPENIQKRYEHREKKVKLEPEVDEEVLKQKIEHERRLLNQEWEYKLDQTRFEHKQELKTLQQVNTQYKKDVDEAERLRSENEDMKKINDQLMEKYEKTLQDNIDRIKRDEEQKQVKPAEQNPNSLLDNQNFANPMDLSMSIVIKDGFKMPNPSAAVVVQTEKLNTLEQIFDRQKAITENHNSDSEDEEVNKDSVFKLQEYLIETESSEDISKPLLVCYLKNKTSRDKGIMIQSMNEALMNEDVLLSLSDMHFHCLIDVFLKFFALEKVAVMKYQAGDDDIDEDAIDLPTSQENITKIQKNISNLLNSKDYTITIKVLLKVLRCGLPDNFEKELTEERRQYLRAMMKCLLRVIKVLDEETEDAVRVFDILIEMNRLFKTHPPDVLKEDLPSLEDFDYVYRCLKVISDKMVEMQPDKVKDFLKFISQDKDNSKTNSFIRYLVQVMSAN